MLRDVDADVTQNTILACAGFDLPPTPPMTHYAPGVDVVLWTFEDVTGVTRVRSISWALK